MHNRSIITDSLDDGTVPGTKTTRKHPDNLVFVYVSHYLQAEGGRR
jgi:hypothetical protein